MPHVEWIIGADDELRHPGYVNQVAQRLRLVYERIEPDPPQVLHRLLASVLARLWPHFVPVIRAAAVARQITATMRGDDFQAGIPVEHAAKDQMRERDRRFERLA